ncbi:hypothetical protein F2P81_007487 [Scophthalmus maximus]|uniref:Uncharacterized protein n=1 Tax=Scophthalmus maximus TaxID=52904 RepID=A0A6A4TAQ7_SCOMX|nr:hypothetical protein F2P81_007487 [Scophthalmus maximus]
MEAAPPSQMSDSLSSETGGDEGPHEQRRDPGQTAEPCCGSGLMFEPLQCDCGNGPRTQQDISGSIFPRPRYLTTGTTERTNKSHCMFATGVIKSGIVQVIQTLSDIIAVRLPVCPWVRVVGRLPPELRLSVDEIFLEYLNAPFVCSDHIIHVVKLFVLLTPSCEGPLPDFRPRLDLCASCELKCYARCIRAGLLTLKLVIDHQHSVCRKSIYVVHTNNKCEERSEKQDTLAHCGLPYTVAISVVNKPRPPPKISVVWVSSFHNAGNAR